MNKLSPEKWIALTGVSQATYHLLCGDGADDAVFILLVAAKTGLTRANLATLLEPYMGMCGKTTISPRIEKACATVLKKLHAPVMNEEVQRFFCPHAPELCWLIDGWPLRIRGAPCTFHPKYKCKILKFMAVSDMTGRILRMLPFPRTDTRMNEGLFADLSEIGPEGSVGLGDKAFVGKKNIVSPDKLYSGKGRLNPSQARWNKFLQIIRSPIERAFSRLHQKWNFCCFSNFSEELSNDIMQCILRIEFHFSPPPCTEWVRLRLYADPMYPSATAASVRKAGIRMFRIHKCFIDLRTRNSTKGAIGEPLFKKPRLEFEKRCKVCAKGLSKCVCPPKRPRGRTKNQ